MKGVLAGSRFECLDFADEFADIVELAVDGDVSDVGDGVDGVEFVHDFGADDFGWDFVEVVFVEFGEDFVYRSADDVHGDFSFFARFDEAAEEFFAVDGFASAVTFDDAEFGTFDLFVGGEAGSAVEAFAATSDRSSVL